MKTLRRTHDADGSMPPPAHPWRATGHETPVFADPSGRRAVTMGGVGLTMAAATLAALVIVVTAAFGFTNVPLSPLPRAIGAASALTAAPHIDHRDPHRLAALASVRVFRRARDVDTSVNRHVHI